MNILHSLIHELNEAHFMQYTAWFVFQMHTFFTQNHAIKRPLELRIELISALVQGKCF